MFKREEIQNFLNYSLDEAKWQEIEQLEDCNNLIKPRYNILGNVYNNLIVIGRGPNKKISTTGKEIGQWWCICSCEKHTILLVRHNNLTSNNTKSCGCLNTQKRKANIKKATEAKKIDLTNQQIYELTILEPTRERKGSSVVWKCQCSCGKIIYAPVNYLRAGRIRSCGHLTESRGSYKIRQLLLNNNIKFTTEKTFSSCRFPDSDAYARFDFYVENKFLIEYDGEQHFLEKDGFFRDSLEKRKQHDNYKTNWCKENNIPLIRFSYKELDLITLEEIQKRGGIL